MFEKDIVSENNSNFKMNLSSKPTPFSFCRAGEYLMSAYQYLKLLKPGISHRYFAAVMGYKSTAAFQDIIKGRVIPKEKALKAIQQIFDLTEGEIEFLMLLFVLQSIRDPFYKKKLFTQSGKLKAVSSKHSIDFIVNNENPI